MNRYNPIHLLTALLLGVLGVLLSGCETNAIAPSENTTRTISFVSHMNTTRAVDEAGMDKLKQKGFGVYGGKYYTDKKGENAYNYLFNNQKVEYQASTTDGITDWIYTPVKYWDVNAIRYDFAAYAPYNASVSYLKNADDTDDKNKFVVSNIPQWQVVDGNEYDLLIAKNLNQPPDKFSNGVVDFEFYHALAKLKVQAIVDAGTTESTYIVTNVTLGGNENKTTGLLVNKDAKVALFNGVSRIYTHDVVNNAGIFSALADDQKGTATIYSDVTGTTIANGDSYTDITELLVAPFKVTTGYTIQIVVTYKKNGETITSQMSATSLDGFESGYQYTLKLKIGATSITVEVAEIQQWVTEDPADDKVYNW